MPSVIQLKKRIKSVGNISKITKAMEMVSASKMRQAQLQALASRHYSRKLDEILGKIASVIDTKQHPLLSSQTDNDRDALLIISTDRGLTGSLNSNLFKAVTKFQKEYHADIYTIGRLAKEYTIKSGNTLVAEFGDVGEKISYDATQPVAGLLMKEFLAGKYQRVWICYMDFISTLSQKPRLTQLLPITHDQNVDSHPSPEGASKDYTFEPDAQSILSWILPYSVELTVYQSMLEARASEHSARMVAMKSASDNANQLKDGLNLKYNRSRQANITSELADIVTASLSVGA